METLQESMKKLSDQIKAHRGVATTPPKPAYTCSTCGDLGYVRASLPANHPLFGRLFPCPDCKQRVSGQPDEYGLLPADRSLSWADILEIDPSIFAAKQTVQAVLSAGYGWVYLWGGYGVAKTAILKIAVAEFLRKAGEPAAYLRMADLMDEIRSAYDAKSPQVEALKRVRWFSTLPVLAIDEFEKVKETGFVEERRFQILDNRYEAATRQEFGVTLLAANVPPGDLPPAIASRVNDGRFRVVHITAQDMRPMAREF